MAVNGLATECCVSVCVMSVGNILHSGRPMTGLDLCNLFVVGEGFCPLYYEVEFFLSMT